jgi:formate dehydrogenase accessory protein FdhD
MQVDRHVASAWVEGADGDGRRDELAVEEPLEIRVDGEPLAVTMRTPGEDEELAAGFLLGEGLIRGPEDVVSVGPTEDLAANVVDVRTASGLSRDPAGERRFYLSSSCGVCGKGALEFVRQEAPPAPRAALLEARVVAEAPAVARRGQPSFERTGGLHATALLDAGGDALAVREDVGRHNAMDKAVGALRPSSWCRRRASRPWPGSWRWARRRRSRWPSRGSAGCCSAASPAAAPSTSMRARTGCGAEGLGSAVRSRILHLG